MSFRFRQTRYFIIQFLACLLIFHSLNAHNRYEIKAIVDPEKGEIHGITKLTFVNETPTAIEAIPIAIASGKITRVISSTNEELRYEPGSSGKPDRIFLTSTLASGKSIQLQIEFTGAYPFNASGYRLAVGAWHPKALVFREGEFRLAERQADSYDVTLTIPSAEVVVTSGKLFQEEPAADRMKQLHYRADNITEFGIASSPKFLATIRELEGVTVRSYYLQGREKWGAKLADYAARIIPFYQKTFGFYPQNVLSILPGSKTSKGGYPAASNMIVVHDTLELPVSHLLNG